MGEKNAEAGGPTIIFKIDMHCQGCALKIKKLVKSFPGVEGLETDCDSNKLTVTGKAVDPAKLRDSLAQKTKKNVQLLLPTAKSDEKGDSKKKPKAASTPVKPKETPTPPPDCKEEKKNKEFFIFCVHLAVVTVAFKTVLHCEGCTNKIRKIVNNYKGVLDVYIDGANSIVTVRGAICVKAFQLYLKKKLRQDVEVVPAANEQKKEEKKADLEKVEKKEEKKSGEKKEEEKTPDKKEEEKTGQNKEDEKRPDKKEEKKSGEKKVEEEKRDQNKKGLVEASAPPAMEINKMQTYGCPIGACSWYWLADEQISYTMSGDVYYCNYAARPLQLPFQELNEDYVVEEYQPSPHVYAPQMFSEENPTACSVM